jgi:hypothetical protein
MTSETGCRRFQQFATSPANHTRLGSLRAQSVLLAARRRESDQFAFTFLQGTGRFSNKTPATPRISYPAVLTDTGTARSGRLL